MFFELKASDEHTIVHCGVMEKEVLPVGGGANMINVMIYKTYKVDGSTGTLRLALPDTGT